MRKPEADFRVEHAKHLRSSRTKFGHGKRGGSHNDSEKRLYWHKLRRKLKRKMHDDD